MWPTWWWPQALMQPGDLDLQRPDLALPVEVGEGVGDALRHRDRARGRQRAIVHARAGDDVRHEPDVRRRKPRRLQPRVDRRQVPPRHVRQDDVLLVADAQLVVGVRLGQVGEHPHLLGGRIARRAAERLQRDRDDRVVRQLVRRDVGVDPGAQAGPEQRRRRGLGLEDRRREGRPDRRDERGVHRPHPRPVRLERGLDLRPHRRRARSRAPGSSAAPCTCCRAARAGCRPAGSPRDRAAGRPSAGTPARSCRSSASVRARRRSAPRSRPRPRRCGRCAGRCRASGSPPGRGRRR